MKCTKLSWQGNTPKSDQFSDIYYDSKGLEESKYVFIMHNGIEKYRTKHKGLTIIETGFGTGLNFLATWQQQSPFLDLDKETTNLHFISVEKYPLSKTDLQQALSHWPELSEYVEKLIAQYPLPIPGIHHLHLTNNVTLTLLFGEATDMLSQLIATADAWYLDGFAPSKNPDMWCKPLFQQMARLSQPGTTFATFTAASSVRKSLEAVGFTVQKDKGFGHKREMLFGVLKSPSTQNCTSNFNGGKVGMGGLVKPLPTNFKSWYVPPPKKNHKTPVAIIGAGLAGCATAYALARKGINATLIEAEKSIAQAASGNPLGLLSPKLSPDSNTTDQYLTQGFLYSCNVINSLSHQGHHIQHHWTGLLHLAVNERLSSRFQSLTTRRELPTEFVELLPSDKASEIAGINLEHSALWLPMAGLVNPSDVCHALAKASNAKSIFNTKVHDIERHKDQWVLLDSDGNVILEADHVVIANANAANQFQQTHHLPIKASPGQLTICQKNAYSKNLKVPLSYEGYITPSIDGQHILGATYRHSDLDIEEKAKDHEYNWDLLARAAPELRDSFRDSPTNYRVATRAITPDHLPMVGPIADFETFHQQFAKLQHGEKACRHKTVEYLPGFFINAGHGSKGLASSLLAGEIIASQIANNAYPVTQQIYQAIHPLRFWVRDLKRTA